MYAKIMEKVNADEKGELSIVDITFKTIKALFIELVVYKFNNDLLQIDQVIKVVRIA